MTASHIEDEGSVALNPHDDEDPGLNINEDAQGQNVVSKSSDDSQVMGLHNDNKESASQQGLKICDRGQAIDPNIKDKDSDGLNDGGQVTDQKIWNWQVNRV